MSPPERLIDNTGATSRFTELLESRNSARVFLIRDERPNAGKTFLLRHLERQCVRPPRSLAAALVDLEHMEDPRPYNLVQTLGRSLRRPDLLPEFTFLNRMLVERQASGIVGTVDARAAELKDNARIIGVLVEQGASVIIDNAASEEAEWEVINAFLRDLAALPDGSPVILMIDSVDEKAGSRKLREWVRSQLVDRTFLDVERRPKNALLVLASRDPELRYDDIPEMDRYVVEAPFLEGWAIDHTRELLELCGDPPDEDALQAFHRAIVERRRPLGDVAVSYSNIWGAGP